MLKWGRSLSECVLSLILCVCVFVCLLGGFLRITKCVHRREKSKHDQKKKKKKEKKRKTVHILIVPTLITEVPLM